MEFKDHWTLLTLLVLLCACSFVCAGRRFNIYPKQSLDFQCRHNETITYKLEGNYLSSAIKIDIGGNLAIDVDKNCSVLVQRPIGYGVIMHIPQLIFIQYIDECGVYIEVFGDKGNSTKICQMQHDKVFQTEGVMRFKFGRRNNTFSSRVTLVLTVFKRDNVIMEKSRFRCNTGEYIWDGFVCDGSVNCPDGSDEFEYGYSRCAEIGAFTIRPINIDWNLIYPTEIGVVSYRRSFNVTISAAIASAVLILLIGLLRFICHYQCMLSQRHSPIERRISIIHPRNNPPHNFHAPPPPYTSLVDDSAIGLAETVSPPDYSTVIGATAATPAQTGTRNGAEKQSGAAIESPPPYEP